MLITIERDRQAYALAKEYLLSFAPLGVTPELLKSYLDPAPVAMRPVTIRGIYQRILESAANRGMSQGVIAGAIGGIGNLTNVLCDFEPEAIIKKYGGRPSAILDAIERELQPTGQVRRTARSLWPLFCRTIVSGASFMSQFHSADEFYAWVDVFDRDDRSRPALPMLLPCEVAGFGFALACDFLKELGYFNFGKPDIHLCSIFKGLGLAEPKASDYGVFKAITRVARHQEVSPYNVDKLFWLVGSGYFYNDRYIGSNGRIGTNRDEFIKQASAKLATVTSA